MRSFAYAGRLRFLLCSVFACMVQVPGAWSQTPPTKAPEGQDVQTATTRAQVKLRQDAFLEQIRSLGFTCPIAAPRIVVEDVPSFGNYEDATNTLHTSAWGLLRPEEKAFFMQLAGPGADEASAHAVFEKAAHGWIFVHELGHWWQACRKLSPEHSHYEVEYGANRIALAYWRSTDPAIVTLMFSLFHQVYEHTPSPVPAGQTVVEFFNKNYEALGPTPAYPWFQSEMNVKLEQETPAPSLKTVLAETK